MLASGVAEDIYVTFTPYEYGYYYETLWVEC